MEDQNSLQLLKKKEKKQEKQEQERLNKDLQETTEREADRVSKVKAFKKSIAKMLQKRKKKAFFNLEVGMTKFTTRNNFGIKNILILIYFQFIFIPAKNKSQHNI